MSETLYQQSGLRFDVAHSVSIGKNETYLLFDGSYLHLREQLQPSTPEEAIMLKRYAGFDTPKVFARQVFRMLDEPSLVQSSIEIPRVMITGTIPEAGDKGIHFWVDSPVPGVNLKDEPSLLGVAEYHSLISWVTNMQAMALEGGRVVTLDQQYQQKAQSALELLRRGYLDEVMSVGGKDLIQRAARLLEVLSREVLEGVEPVLMHGDLHVANILKVPNSPVMSVVDFEASIEGPGDTLKDVQKLLHLDYEFLDVSRVAESATLDGNQKSDLLQYFIDQSSRPDVKLLKDEETLLKRLLIIDLSTYMGRAFLAATPSLKGKEAHEKLLGTLSDLSLVVHAAETLSAS